MKKLNDLTVFIISSGEDTEHECLNALHNQNCVFEIKYIRNQCPMSKAFQLMPELCATRYFIQVDADMILHPGAVLSLYNSIKESPFWIYRISYALYEEDFGVGGAVKCWKTNIFNYFKFDDVRTVDRSFHSKVKWFGFRYQHESEVIGVHRPRHSPFSMYLKTKSDIEKWRFLGRDVKLYALPLINNIFDNHDDEFFVYKVLGVLQGATSSANIVSKSKDICVEKDVYEQMCLCLLGVGAIKDNIIAYDRKKLFSLFCGSYSETRAEMFNSREELKLLVRKMFYL